MLLTEIAAHLGVRAGEAIEVKGLALASDQVKPGDLFIALPGAHTHGSRFIGQAKDRGAVAVLTDSEGAHSSQLPTLVVDSPREILGTFASWFYGAPSEQLCVMGVTGTNGKTTTTYFAEAAARAAGATTGLIGTVETRIDSRVLKSERTTPEAPQLQALLAEMVSAGVSHVAMEVSSHALALGRVSGTTFASAGFTNLSQDHLDFHGDMESYFQAKAMLFAEDFTKNAVINVDDAYGRRLFENLDLAVLAISSQGPADWYAEKIECTASGSTATIVDPFGRTYPMSIKIPGRYNIDNALMAIALASSTGLDTAALVEGLSKLDGVPGRMERIDLGQPFSVVVDYAHTPDAVESLLGQLRTVTTGKIIGVLGCGGDRDAAKRPLMGRALAQGCDVAILTSDNPRSEDPISILTQMESGAREVSSARVMVEADRRVAITQAIALAQPGDCVVIAGKGHEQGQEVNGVITAFDDRQVAREAIK